MSSGGNDEEEAVRRLAVRGRIPALRGLRADAVDLYEKVSELVWRHAYLAAWASGRPTNPFEPTQDQIELDGLLADLAQWAGLRPNEAFVSSAPRPIVGALPAELEALIAELEAWASMRPHKPFVVDPERRAVFLARLKEGKRRAPAAV